MIQNQDSTAALNCKSEKPDEITLTSFKGPVTNTTPDNSDSMEWDEFSGTLSKPEQGDKDGSYFVRGKCPGNRCDSNMEPLSDIIVIDADNGPDGHPCPPVDYVADTLQDLDYQFIFYTSFSHTPEKPKYRIIFLLNRPVDQSESKRVYKGIINTLYNNGVRIGKNSESDTWSQPFFFPRYKTEEQRKNFFHAEGGFKKLPVDAILIEVPENGNAPIPELTQDQILKLKKNIPACIQYYITDTELETTDRRNFNLIKMVLVAYSLSTDLDEDEAVSLGQEFIDNYFFSNSLKTPQARLSNFKKCYRSMKQGGCTFSCGSVKALGAPGNAFDCEDCSVEKPHDIEDVLDWLDETEEKKDILAGWMEKTKGMDAVSTDTVLRAVSKKIEVGIRPLAKDLKEQQLAWQREKIKLAREKKSANRKAEGKIEIYYSKTATGAAVYQMSKTLAASTDLNCVYRYGSTLVSIVNARPANVRMVKRIYDNNGIYPAMPLIHTHSPETLRHELETMAYCIEVDDKETMWPLILIKGLMEIPNSFEKPLIGIAEHPYVDENFYPVTDWGYDARTGLFKYIASDLILDFDGAINIERSEAAYKYLRDEVMADFPFATTLDMVGAISTLLTALQRKLITGDSGCPGYLFDAPTQSTGKTTLAQIISYTIYNRPAAATSWSNDDNELGKHILGILREGHSCVLFDNVTNGTVLESDELAKAMTSATYSKRLLGENKTVTVPSCVLWLFTGNNISVAGDFNTRILSIRLDAKMADPDRRTFKRSDIGEWCLDNRSVIIHACMTIILAAKGIKIDLSPTRYNEWDKFVRCPLYIATGVDIADLFERNKAADPKIEGQKIFLEILYHIFRGRPVSAKDILKKAQQESGDYCQDATGICDAIQDIFGGNLPTTSSFGKWLKGLKDRVIGGYKLTATEGSGRKNKNIWLWSVESISGEDALPI